MAYPYYPNYPNYQAPYTQPMQDQLAQLRGMQYQQPQQPAQPQTNMIWVQGEAGAKSYLMSPNTTLPLWDSENQTIYIKSTDAGGMPSMRILDYTERSATLKQTSANATDYVTRQEFDALTARLDAMAANARPTRTQKQKEDVENG